MASSSNNTFSNNGAVPPNPNPTGPFANQQHQNQHPVAPNVPSAMYNPNAFNPFAPPSNQANFGYNFGQQASNQQPNANGNTQNANLHMFKGVQMNVHGAPNGPMPAGAGFHGGTNMNGAGFVYPHQMAAGTSWNGQYSTGGMEDGAPGMNAPVGRNATEGRDDMDRAAKGSAKKERKKKASQKRSKKRKTEDDSIYEAEEKPISGVERLQMIAAGIHTIWGVIDIPQSTIAELSKVCSLDDLNVFGTKAMDKATALTEVRGVDVCGTLCKGAFVHMGNARVAHRNGEGYTVTALEVGNANRFIREFEETKEPRCKAIERVHIELALAKRVSKYIVEEAARTDERIEAKAKMMHEIDSEQSLGDDLCVALRKLSKCIFMDPESSRWKELRADMVKCLEAHKDQIPIGVFENVFSMSFDDAKRETAEQVAVTVGEEKKASTGLELLDEVTDRLISSGKEPSDLPDEEKESLATEWLNVINFWALMNYCISSSGKEAALNELGVYGVDALFYNFDASIADLGVARLYHASDNTKLNESVTKAATTLDRFQKAANSQEDGIKRAKVKGALAEEILERMILKMQDRLTSLTTCRDEVKKKRELVNEIEEEQATGLDIYRVTLKGLNFAAFGANGPKFTDFQKALTAASKLEKVRPDVIALRAVPLVPVPGQSRSAEDLAVSKLKKCNLGGSVCLGEDYYKPHNVNIGNENGDVSEDTITCVASRGNSRMTNARRVVADFIHSIYKANSTLAHADVFTKVLNSAYFGGKTLDEDQTNNLSTLVRQIMDEVNSNGED